MAARLSQCSLRFSRFSPGLELWSWPDSAGVQAEPAGDTMPISGHDCIQTYLGQKKRGEQIQHERDQGPREMTPAEMIDREGAGIDPTVAGDGVDFTGTSFVIGSEAAQILLRDRLVGRYTVGATTSLCDLLRMLSRCCADAAIAVEQEDIVGAESVHNGKDTSWREI